MALQTCERGAAVCNGVDSNTEPRHAVRAKNSKHAGGQNNEHGERVLVLQISKVIEDARADKNPQQRQELALLPEVALACFPNNVGNIGHALVHWQCFGLTVLVPTKHTRQDADNQAHHHEVVALDDRVAKLKVCKVN